MKFRLKFLILQAVVTSLLLLPQTIRASGGMPIEQAQRAFQARYHYIWLSVWNQRSDYPAYVTWPPCPGCGGMMPAPAFPPDGYYENASTNRSFAMALVFDLAEKYFNTYGSAPWTKIADNFVRGSLEGANPIPRFTENDYDPSFYTGYYGINEANYISQCQALLTYILRLQSIPVNTIECPGLLDCRGGDSESDPTNSCETARADALSKYSTGTNDCSIDELNAGSRVFSKEVTSAESPDGLTWTNWSAVLIGGYARFGFNLSNHTGNADLYLMETSHDLGVVGSRDNAPVNVDGNYHCIGIAGTGGMWLSDLYPGGNPSFTLPCDPPPPECPEAGWKTNGMWEVDSALVVVTPTFDESPSDDEIKCGGGCGDVCTSGSSYYGAGSVAFNIRLGFGSYGRSAGYVMLHEEQPSHDLATPRKLRYSISSDVDPVLAGDNISLRQLLSPQGLVDVVTNSDFSYVISLYKRSQVGDFINNVYTTNGSPFATFTVEIPDAYTNSYDHLNITETRDGNSVVNQFVWSAANSQWTLIRAGGLRTESRSKVWDSSRTNRTEVFTITNPDTSIAYKETKAYHIFPWGLELVTNTVGDGSAALTTIRTYYDDVATNNSNYGHLKRLVEPNGRWEEYTYDGLGRLATVTAAFQDSQTRVTTKTYSDTAPHETSVDTIGGVGVSRHYRAFFTNGDLDETWDVQAVNSTDPWNSTNHLITVTRSYNSGFFSYEPISVLSPDGTFMLYEYNVDGQTKTTTVSRGQPNGNDTDIVNGTRTITVQSYVGTVLSETNYAIIDGSDPLVLSGSATLAADDFGRVTMSEALDGINSSSYACCGLESTTNAEGIVTTYGYDDLKRVTSTTQAGIPFGHDYDAAGRTIATFRNGVMISSNTYDVAGRVTSSTDALNHTTRYFEFVDGDGHLVKSNAFADGSCRIETYYKDGQLMSVTGSAVHGVVYEYGADGDGLYTIETRLKDDGSESDEWTKSWADLAGRVWKSQRAGCAASYSYYNGKGQLTKQIDPDGVRTLFTYNSLGELEVTAIDIDQDGSIGSVDRITSNVTDVVDNDLGVVHRTRTYVYSESEPVLSAVTETTNNGLVSRTTAYDLTNTVVTVYDRPNARRTVTTTAPDNSTTVSVFENGRLLSVTRQATGQTTYTYDCFGRQSSSTDGRNITTAHAYNAADQLVAITNAVGTVDQQVTSFHYDNVGRRDLVTLPDSGTVTYEYYSTGELKTTYGARTYRVEYGYDYAGRIQTNKTWRAYPSLPEVTTWNYDSQRGFLTSKHYNDTNGPSYTYTDAGRLETRTWQRSITSTYAYNHAGDLGAITYSDGTPAVASVYDRRGRRTSVTNGTQVATFAYNNAGQLLTESFPNSGVIITNTYDSLLRRSSLSGTPNGFGVSYSYDAASRLSTVAQASLLANYTYLPDSSLVSNIVFATSGVTKMTTTKSYDNLNRLTAIESGTGVSPVSSHSYQFNSANQRTRATLADNSYWIYQYDALGQVTSGKKYWSDSSEVAGQQFGYSFDEIGNRETATVNGNTGTYTANNLNQYTQRTVPGYVWELGSATNNATVTINNQPVSRRADYFWKELSVTNGSSAVYTQLTTVAALLNGGSNTNQSDVVTEETGHAFVARSPETFSYDADGNLLSDGRWTNMVWDAENRLISMETAVPVVNAGAPHEKLLFGYDYMGRRVSKVVSNFVSGSWTLTTNLKFVYDGWNLAAELDGNNNLVRSYTWGLDLSGSMQGAGGIGGLLLISNHGSPVTNSFVAYDGNGNVTTLVDASTGSNTAEYAFGPFGEILRANGSMAKANPFRFSTKYQDDETDLLYYGYRFFNPYTGRWVSRDPIGEGGGANLYAYLINNAVGRIDILGLLDYKFEVVVGNPFSFGSILAGSGRWGQPWTHADGSYLIAGTRAYSSVTITSRNAPLGSCNTVDQPDPAGTIYLYLRDNCPGVFQVSIYGMVQLTGTGLNILNPAKLQAGAMMLIDGKGSTLKPFEEDGLYEFNAHVGVAWTLVATYMPTLSLPQDFGVTSTITAYGFIEFLSATR